MGDVAELAPTKRKQPVEVGSRETLLYKEIALGQPYNKAGLGYLRT